MARRRRRGRAPYPLTTGEDGSPAWSPDGTRLAFTRGDGEGGGSLRVAPVGGTVTVRTGPVAVEAPAWSPVFVVAADGSSAPVQVAAGPYDHGDPAWAGERIVVSAARRPGADPDLRADLHLLDPTGRTGPEPLTASALSLWMPDGSRVAALGEDVGVVPSPSRVVVVDVATARRTCSARRSTAGARPTRDPEQRCGGARTPVEDHGDVHVYRVGPEGGPTWVPGGTRAVRGFDAVGDTLAFVASTPTVLGELFVRNADGTERQLTRPRRAATGREQPEVRLLEYGGSPRRATSCPGPARRATASSAPS